MQQFAKLGFVAMEMEEKTYSYPVKNFKFDPYFEYNREVNSEKHSR